MQTIDFTNENTIIIHSLMDYAVGIKKNDDESMTIMLHTLEYEDGQSDIGFDSLASNKQIKLNKDNEVMTTIIDVDSIGSITNCRFAKGIINPTISIDNEYLEEMLRVYEETGNVPNTNFALLTDLLNIKMVICKLMSTNYLEFVGKHLDEIEKQKQNNQMSYGSAKHLAHKKYMETVKTYKK